MPLTQTTRCQALAMFVVYDSPLQMGSDDPDAYRDAEGFEFIRRVPTAWDETRFLAGEPGAIHRASAALRCGVVRGRDDRRRDPPHSARALELSACGPPISRPRGKTARRTTQSNAASAS